MGPRVEWTQIVLFCRYKKYGFTDSNTSVVLIIGIYFLIHLKMNVLFEDFWKMYYYSMYFSRVGNIFKVDKKRCPNAKNMRIYYMNLWKKRWMQYSTHVKSYEQKCVQPCVLRHSPLRIKSSHYLLLYCPIYLHMRVCWLPAE